MRLISAGNIFTSSMLLSRAINCCTGEFQFDFTWKGCGCSSSPWCMYWGLILLSNCSKSHKSCHQIWLCFVTGVGEKIESMSLACKLIRSSVNCVYFRANV